MWLFPNDLLNYQTQSLIICILRKKIKENHKLSKSPWIGICGGALLLCYHLSHKHDSQTQNHLIPLIQCDQTHNLKISLIRG